MKNNDSEEFALSLKQKENEENLKSYYFVENEDDYEIKNIEWPKIGEFNEKIAIDKIDEFIKNVFSIFFYI